MPSKSKEETVLRLILENSPLKHWHFEELVKKTKMTRAAVNKWLKKFQEQNLISRVKERGKFPYFTVGSNNPYYLTKKRIYVLNRFHEAGLIDYLSSLEKAETIILFGSMAKGDWYKDSDIDIFILGKLENIEKQKFETRLKRDIEFHIFESKEELKQLRTGLLKNIIDGYVVKGSINDLMKVDA